MLLCRFDENVERYDFNLYHTPFPTVRVYYWIEGKEVESAFTLESRQFRRKRNRENFKVSVEDYLNALREEYNVPYSGLLGSYVIVFFKDHLINPNSMEMVKHPDTSAVTYGGMIRYAKIPLVHSSFRYDHSSEDINRMLKCLKGDV